MIARLPDLVREKAREIGPDWAKRQGALEMAEWLFDPVCERCGVEVDFPHGPGPTGDYDCSLPPGTGEVTRAEFLRRGAA